MNPYQYRIGIDLGGTKIEALALTAEGPVPHRVRVPTPPGYAPTLAAIAGLVRDLDQRMGGHGSVGVGIPGAISPATGLVKGANSTALNGHPLDADLAALVGRPVRVANDANCFALSEAADGAGAGHSTVFGVILGTGCGGGIVIDGTILEGRHRIAGEWGHTPLPWPEPRELPGNACNCGRRNCLETWISGTGLARMCDGPAAHDASGIPARAAAGEALALAALERHVDRLARGLAVVVNMLDPHVIVLGGGLSNMDHLYEQVPARMARYVYSDVVNTPILRNLHGDSSGVRGAAWLWPPPA